MELSLEISVTVAEAFRRFMATFETITGFDYGSLVNHTHFHEITGIKNYMTVMTSVGWLKGKNGRYN